MGLLNNEIFALLCSNMFKKMANCNTLQIVEFNTMCTLLIKTGIPFDAKYSNATRRDEANLSITIYINPSTTLTYIFEEKSDDSGKNP